MRPLPVRWRYLSRRWPRIRGFVVDPASSKKAPQSLAYSNRGVGALSGPDPCVLHVLVYRLVRIWRETQRLQTWFPASGGRDGTATRACEPASGSGASRRVCCGWRDCPGRPRRLARRSALSNGSAGAGCVVAWMGAGQCRTTALLGDTRGRWRRRVALAVDALAYGCPPHSSTFPSSFRGCPIRPTYADQA